MNQEYSESYSQELTRVMRGRVVESVICEDAHVVEIKFRDGSTLRSECQHGSWGSQLLIPAHKPESKWMRELRRKLGGYRPGDLAHMLGIKVDD